MVQRHERVCLALTGPAGVRIEINVRGPAPLDPGLFGNEELADRLRRAFGLELEHLRRKERAGREPRGAS